MTKEDIAAKAREVHAQIQARAACAEIHGAWCTQDYACNTCEILTSKFLAIHDAAYEAGRRDESEYALKLAWQHSYSDDVREIRSALLGRVNTLFAGRSRVEQKEK